MTKLLNMVRRLKIRINSKRIIYHLTHYIGERNIINYENLKKSENYVFSKFFLYNKNAYKQYFEVNGHKVCNIIAEKKGTVYPDQYIIIGAHYDTVEGSPGANDNGSAVATLIELQRLVANIDLKYSIIFISFCLEEPPYYSTPNMGSMVYAKMAREENKDIKLMIALDMLAYGSRFTKQTFPFDNSNCKYPSTGNFLSVCALPSNAPYAFLWKKLYNRQAKNKIYDMIGPASVPGINLSDHFSFHQYKFPALMITDTGYYRNRNYHASSDIYDTLNYHFLADNILNIFYTLVMLDSNLSENNKD